MAKARDRNVRMILAGVAAPEDFVHTLAEHGAAFTRDGSVLEFEVSPRNVRAAILTIDFYVKKRQSIADDLAINPKADPQNAILQSSMADSNKKAAIELLHALDKTYLVVGY